MFRHIVGSPLVVTAALSLILSVGPVQAAEFTAAEAQKFFNDKHCNACHAADEERIGPTYQIIATRYAGASPDKIDWLAKKIILGGAGAWGVVPMISYPGMSEEEAHKVARWILKLYKPKPSS